VDGFGEGERVEVWKEGGEGGMHRKEAREKVGRAPLLPPSRSHQPTQPTGFRPKDTVLYAERDLIVVNKPPGLPMVAGGEGAGRMSVTSVYSPRALGLRAGQFLAPVHDLLTAASGVLVLSKNEQMHALYAAEFGGKPPPATQTPVPHVSWPRQGPHHLSFA
jgi:23S rRNA-/tRNA-specific pseudouridylate synthase